jgi:hypothetical protein
MSVGVDNVVEVAGHPRGLRSAVLALLGAAALVASLTAYGQLKASEQAEATLLRSSVLVLRAFRVYQVRDPFTLLKIRTSEHLADVTGNAAEFRRSLIANHETDIGNVVFFTERRAYRDLRRALTGLLEGLPDDPALDPEMAADLATSAEVVIRAGKAFRAGFAYTGVLSQREDRLGFSLFLVAVAVALLALVAVMERRRSAWAMLFLGSSFLLASGISTTLAYL